MTYQSKIFRLTSALLLLSLLHFASPQAIIIRNFGCQTYNAAGTCTNCSIRYYLDSNTICQPVNPNCNTYDPTNGDCLTCYPGFGIIEGTCLPGLVSSSFDPNCNQFSGSACIKCSKGYFLSSSGTCSQVNPSCNTYDPANGACTSCFAGYSVQNGDCLISKTQAAAANCNSIDSATGNCLKCSSGYYFDPNGNCVMQDPNCKTFDTANQICKECYPGYSLISGGCQQSQASAGDPNCKTFNGSICLECAKGAIFNPNLTCIVVDPTCYTFNSNDGTCTGCYPGYALSGVQCLLSNDTSTSDPNCNSYLTPDVCAKCSTRYYIGSDGICVMVNALCNTYDPTTGNCLTCYPGFTAVEGICLAATASNTDNYCKTWNGSVCVECAFGAFFLANRTCAVANPLCRTFDPANGNCLTCYTSFQISGGNCVKSDQILSDPNCAQFFESVCLKCSDGYIFLDSGLCGLVNTNCKDYDSLTGVCTSCYLGYSLDKGNCVNGTNDQSAIDQNCASFANGICIKCSKNFFFSKGICTVVNPLCNGYNQSTGACLGCYQSYVLQSGDCIQDRNNSLTDPNCASWLQGVCLSCGSRTFMNNSGLCQDVSINCNTYDLSNGSCTSCYPGFQLGAGVCTLALSPSSCNRFNPDGSCAVCGSGSYLSKGSCIAIDQQCANFDQVSLTCLSCYPGYSILNGACQISKVDSQYAVENCYAYDQLNRCISCYDRFYLTVNTCKAVSVFCKTYDNNTGNCLTCYTTFKLTNGACNSAQ